MNNHGVMMTNQCWSM